MAGSVPRDDYFLQIRSPFGSLDIVDLIPAASDVVLLGWQESRTASGTSDVGAVLLGLDAAGAITWQGAVQTDGPVTEPPSEWQFRPTSVTKAGEGYLVVGTLSATLAPTPSRVAIASFNAGGGCLWLRVYDINPVQHATGVGIVDLGPDDYLVIASAASRKVVVDVGESWSFRIDRAGNPRPGFRSTALGLAWPYRLRRFGDVILVVGLTFRAEDFRTDTPAPGWLERLDATGRPMFDRAYLDTPPTVSSAGVRDIAMGTNGWLAIGQFLMAIDGAGHAIWGKEPDANLGSIDGFEFIALPATAGERENFNGFKSSFFAIAGFLVDNPGRLHPWLGLSDEAGNLYWEKNYPNRRVNEGRGFARTRWINSAGIAAAGGSWGQDVRGVAVRSETDGGGGGFECGVDRPIDLKPVCIRTTDVQPVIEDLILTMTECRFEQQPPVTAENRCDRFDE